MRAKKSLGQHFLKSKEALRLILDTSDPTATDIVLEIGPGKGALTEVLLPFPAKIIAVEKDKELVAMLKEKFRTQIKGGKLDIYEGDILEFDPTILKSYDPNIFDYKVVANIPYYITGAILKKFLSSEYQPSHMVLLLQKEVADRIIARDGKESILSLSVKAYGKPRYIKKVAKKYFSPQPKVDSAILSIENISREFFNDISEDLFFKLVKAGFSHKRKLLIKNLSSITKKNLETVFKKVGIPLKARAEDVRIEDWKNLVEHLLSSR